MVRSPTGDIDILALFVSHDFGDINIYIDNETGKSRKITSSELSAEEKVALIGYHAFSANDYVSSSFRKGKSAFWKATLKRREFSETFSQLRKEVIDVTDDLFKALEKFVCFLNCFPKDADVNAVRRSIFWDKLKKNNLIVEISLLPPCRENLQFHVMRSNYVGYIFRNADRLFIDIDSPTNHGWDEQLKVIWSSLCYPPDVSEFLFDMQSDDDSESDHDINVTTDFDDRCVSSFQGDLDDDVEDISLFD